MGFQAFFKGSHVTRIIFHTKTVLKSNTLSIIYVTSYTECHRKHILDISHHVYSDTIFHKNFLSVRFFLKEKNFDKSPFSRGRTFLSEIPISTTNYQILNVKYVVGIARRLTASLVFPIYLDFLT